MSRIGGKKGHLKKTRDTNNSRRLRLKGEDGNKNEFYAIITKNLGGPRMQVKDADKVLYQASIPGSMSKGRGGNRMNIGDLVLCSANALTTNYSNKKTAMIEHLYKKEEIMELKKAGQLNGFEEYRKDITFNFEDMEETTNNNPSVLSQNRKLDLNDIDGSSEENTHDNFNVNDILEDIDYQLQNL